MLIIKVYFIRFVYYLLLLSGLSGCYISTVKNDVAKIADDLAAAHGFEKRLVPGGDFVITVYQKITDFSLPIVIYIEGDGSISSGSFASLNPTPLKPMLLKLALSDQRPNVAYLGRPCQYTPMEQNPKCHSSFWTNKRLSEPVIDSLNRVINKITKNQRFDLVGFSGGGAAAVLIGARNTNVNTILTLAGNLDLDAFSKYHSSISLMGSLNPMNYIDQVAHIPQLHVVGNKDKVIPSFIVRKFVENIKTGCAQYKSIQNVSHLTNWDLHWQDILSIPIVCYPPE